MSDVVIRAEGLGKKYVIGHQAQAERNPTLRDVVVRTANGFLRSARDMLRGAQIVAGDEIEEFWALKDVNFEIRRGEVVGVVGRNGAGKSTLLKILSQITEPTTGRVEIKGRVASLLEVGTGFHPELSGRENVYLNGTILGMSRAEIRQKFDEMVAFAEIEKFLDTPVKRYSSGMYVRLAFAVAAHLEPEILIVDEVLAVGDAEFQNKCLGKMGEVAGQGRTVLFVSHNIAAIKRICERGMLLSRGRLVADGTLESVLKLRGDVGAPANQFERKCNPLRPASIVYGSVQVDEPGRAGAGPDAIIFDLHIFAAVDLKASIELKLMDRNGAPVAFTSFGTLDDTKLISFFRGMNKFIVKVPGNNLAIGDYVVSILLVNPGVEIYDRADESLRFSLSAPDIGGARRRLVQAWDIGSIVLDGTISAFGAGDHDGAEGRANWSSEAP